LLAQLKNQDPLNPMDSSQFSSQLAQFSTLEQITKVNTNLNSLIDSQQSVNKYKSLDLIGKEIEADGNDISLSDSGASKGDFTIASAADCTAIIYNSDGTKVKTIDLGNLKAGDHTFQWDGTNLAGKTATNGTYTYKIVAEGSLGETITATTRMRGVVDKVNLDEDDPTLCIGNLSIALSDVSNITLAED
jgi:flagellar basal-body rod modification protein FlgD